MVFKVCHLDDYRKSYRWYSQVLSMFANNGNRRLNKSNVERKTVVRNQCPQRFGLRVFTLGWFCKPSACWRLESPGCIGGAPSSSVAPEKLKFVYIKTAPDRNQNTSNGDSWESCFKSQLPVVTGMWAYTWRHRLLDIDHGPFQQEIPLSSASSSSGRNHSTCFSEWGQ